MFFTNVKSAGLAKGLKISSDIKWSSGCRGNSFETHYCVKLSVWVTFSLSLSLSPDPELLSLRWQASASEMQSSAHIPFHPSPGAGGWTCYEPYPHGAWYLHPLCVLPRPHNFTSIFMDVQTWRNSIILMQQFYERCLNWKTVALLLCILVF